MKQRPLTIVFSNIHLNIPQPPSFPFTSSPSSTNTSMAVACPLAAAWCKGPRLSTAGRTAEAVHSSDKRKTMGAMTWLHRAKVYMFSSGTLVTYPEDENKTGISVLPLGVLFQEKLRMVFEWKKDGVDGNGPAVGRGWLTPGPKSSVQNTKWKIGKGHPAEKEKASCCLVRDMETSQVYQKSSRTRMCWERKIDVLKAEDCQGPADKEACIYCTLFNLVHMFSWFLLISSQVEENVEKTRPKRIWTMIKCHAWLSYSASEPLWLKFETKSHRISLNL